MPNCHRLSATGQPFLQVLRQPVTISALGTCRSRPQARANFTAAGVWAGHSERMLMPALIRRNVGASLTETTTKSRHADHVQSGGDRHVASRARHDQKWSQAGSVLERRAEQSRTDQKRAGQLARFSNSVKGDGHAAALSARAVHARLQQLRDCDAVSEREVPGAAVQCLQGQTPAVADFWAMSREPTSDARRYPQAAARWGASHEAPTRPLPSERSTASGSNGQIRLN